jgi:nitrite reductase/ring-hydroxylating ferredoxin subunit
MPRNRHAARFSAVHDQVRQGNSKSRFYYRGTAQFAAMRGRLIRSQEGQMNHPPSRTNLPRNCTFDPGDWRILTRSWFPVAIAAQAAAGPIGAVLLDQPLVVYRTGMSFIVAGDLCPHRGVPLSMGFQDGDRIRCAYHGLRFGAEGKCDHVPTSPDMRIPDRLHLKTYPAVEKYGLIWTRLRGAAEADPEK